MSQNAKKPKVDGKIYFQLYQAWRKAFGQSETEKKIQEDCNEFWRANRTDPETVTKKLQQLNRIVNTQKSIYAFFANVKPKEHEKANSTQADPNAPTSSSVHPSEPSNASASSVLVSVASDTSDRDEEEEKQRESPVYAATAEKLSKTNDRIDSLNQLKNVGIGLNDEQAALLKKLAKTKTDLKKKLTALKNGKKAAKKYRAKKKKQMEDLKKSYPHLLQELSEITTDTIGRPRLESKQPALLETIVKLVSPSGAAENRRRSEKLRSCQTLDELLGLLKQEGFQISRTALYLRLLPRCCLTAQGKRHVHTVPVRLIRAQNNFRKKHPDFHFTAATMMWLKQIGEILGEQSVCLISQDDKARVPLGLAAASKQAPILMHLDYCVKLPDHDWVVATKHKLIPSVYAGLCFDAKGKVSYSGPTYIAIRSGKHDSSTARSHATDFRRLHELENFQALVKRKNGTWKPIVIILSDGGPDENPRFPKTLLEAYRHFLRYDLDAFFVGCYAPGLSAFNPVERKMAPLSRDLSGIIIPHDSFGSHLDGSGRTVDEELEKENFENAGKLLASVWNENLIDGYEVFSEYISPNSSENYDTSQPSAEWIWSHVRQSQYLLQIVKCKNPACCSPTRSNIFDLLVDRFLPSPLLFSRGDVGLRLCDPTEDSKAYFGDLCHRLALKHMEPVSEDQPILPFDLYCPSVSSKLSKRTCKSCHYYCPSQTALRSHRNVHRSVKTSSIFDTFEEEYEPIESVDEEFPVIECLDSWSEPIFTTEWPCDDVHTPI